MEVAWHLAEGIECRVCPNIEEMVVYSSLSGAVYVIANLGYLVVDACCQGPQTADALILKINDTYEVDRPEELTSATWDTVRQLESLGILTQCAPFLTNLEYLQS